MPKAITSIPVKIGDLYLPDAIYSFASHIALGSSLVAATHVVGTNGEVILSEEYGSQLHTWGKFEFVTTEGDTVLWYNPEHKVLRVSKTRRYVRDHRIEQSESCYYFATGL